MIIKKIKHITFNKHTAYILGVVADNILTIKRKRSVGLEIFDSDLRAVKDFDILKPIMGTHPLEQSSRISIFKKNNNDTNILLYEHNDRRNEHFIYLNLQTLLYEVIPITCNLYEGISVDDQSYVWEMLERLYLWKDDKVFFVNEDDIFYVLSLDTRLTVPVEQKWVKENLKDLYDAFVLYKEYGLASKVYVEEKKFIYRVEQDGKYYAVAVDCVTKEQEVLYEGDYYWFRMEQSSRFWLFISYEAIEVVDRISGQVKIIYPKKYYSFGFSKFINDNTFVSNQWRHCNPCISMLTTHFIEM